MNSGLYALALSCLLAIRLVTRSINQLGFAVWLRRQQSKTQKRSVTAHLRQGTEVDTTKFVRVMSSTYFEFGRVVEVTPEGDMVVQAPRRGGPGDALYLFDHDGKHCRGMFECLPLLDIKALEIDQKVLLQSGVYGLNGKVVKVTPSGIEVWAYGWREKDGAWHSSGLMHFDGNGKGCDGGTFECGPWYISSLIEEPKRVVGQDVYLSPGSPGYGYWKGRVVKSTSAGVEVQLLDPWPGESLIRFGKNGVELEVRRNMNVAPEQQPWLLDDMPLEERSAHIENCIAANERSKRLLEIKKAHLIVGQEVWMFSGPYWIKGKVVQSAPISVLVQELPWRDKKGGELRRFFYFGTQRDGSHHPECGPWTLDDMPFAERTETIEKDSP